MIDNTENDIPEGEDLVEEARRGGEAYLAQFNFDLAAACDDLRRRTEEARRAGRRVISFPPRRPQPHATVSAKRVG
jgi:hypothetical protein